MRSIGFRVTPEVTFYAVVEPTDNKGYCVVASETIKHPKVLDEPQKLAHLRTTVTDLFNSFEAVLGGIKLMEGNSRTVNLFRLNCEGVIQEAFASTNLKRYFFGAIPALTGAFGFQDKKHLKSLIDGTVDPDFCKWGKLKTESREAVLAAVAALKNHGC